MTTKVIDIAFHGSSFPATYTGPGTLVGNAKQSPLAKDLSLYWTSEGSDVQIPLGDEPLAIRIVNETDVVIWEWQRGMTNVIKIVGSTGVETDDTNGYVTVTTSGGKSTVALSASLLGTSKAISIIIKG